MMIGNLHDTFIEATNEKLCVWCVGDELILAGKVQLTTIAEIEA